jgi:cardiolipin synthase A/B
VNEVAWWVWALAGIGGFALASGVVSLFFSLGRRPSAMRMEVAPAIETDAFLRAVTGNLNLAAKRGGSIRMLHNGDEYYARMLETIRRAEHTVNFSCYIWEPGRISDQFFEALIERAEHGVEVRLLLDGFGGLRAPRSSIRRLRRAGGSVKRFRSFRFGKILRFHKRNHRRAIVIDGRIAYTGGSAISDKWAGNAQDPDHWRDVMVEVTGPMAASLQAAFADLWDYAGSEILAGDGQFPALSADGTDGADGADDTAPHRDDAPRHVHVVSSPTSDAHPLRTFFLLTFYGARQRIWIASPYFVPDSFTRKLMASRARAGVEVLLLLPNEHSDAKPIRQTSHSYYQELLEAGVRIFEYQPTFMHAKLLVADGVWSVVGSANMDIRSKELNKENVLAVMDRNFAADVEASFRADLLLSREIRLEEWRRRGIAKRALERVCALFAEQY